MAGTRIARLSSRRSRTRGYRKQHGLLGDASPADPAADESNGTPLEVRRSCLRRAFVPSSGRGAQARRARLIRQVYEVDPLPCSQCGGRMKVIAVIDQEEVIYRSAELTTKPLFDLPVRRTQTGALPIPDPVSV